jgi:hypothetical protein
MTGGPRKDRWTRGCSSWPRDLAIATWSWPPSARAAWRGNDLDGVLVVVQAPGASLEHVESTVAPIVASVRFGR